jgi:hypothetical protein
MDSEGWNPAPGRTAADKRAPEVAGARATLIRDAGVVAERVVAVAVAAARARAAQHRVRRPA